MDGTFPTLLKRLGIAVQRIDGDHDEAADVEREDFDKPSLMQASGGKKWVCMEARVMSDDKASNGR